MKNKKGFVLVETIIVMSVVMIALIGIYNSYVTVIKKAKQKMYYDNINDVYALNIIKKMMNGNYQTINYESLDYYAYENKFSLFPDLGFNIDEEFGDYLYYDVNIIYYTPSTIADDLSLVDSLGTNYVNSFKRYLQTTNYNNKDLLILRYIDAGKNERYASLEV